MSIVIVVELTNDEKKACRYHGITEAELEAELKSEIKIVLDGHVRNAKEKAGKKLTMDEIDPESIR